MNTAIVDRAVRVFLTVSGSVRTSLEMWIADASIFTLLAKY
jgi:hypothetical protein